ncbi:Formate dehydrogenase, nitrate-inducible, iron-sulfur subunit [compost metagenome]
MCYDRTSVGKKPMCATVCPSGALFYGTRNEIEEMRPNSTPINNFIFGKEKVKTKVNIMMPKGSKELRIY